MAAAFATASETPRMALAPSSDLSALPSRSSILVSIRRCSSASYPISSSAILSSTLLTAFSTPLPRYRPLSPSRSSIASNAPVEAPEGTAARPTVPSSSPTSTSTVGLPRESRISRATIASMVAMCRVAPLVVRLQFSDRDPAADHGPERNEPRWRAYARPVNFRPADPQARSASADHPGTMSTSTLPPDGSFIEMTSYGESLPEVRVLHAAGSAITLSLALAHVPPANSTVELRWAAATRGRYAQEGYVVAVDGNRVQVRFTGQPAVLQSRL